MDPYGQFRPSRRFMLRSKSGRFPYPTIVFFCDASLRASSLAGAECVNSPRRSPLPLSGSWLRCGSVGVPFERSFERFFRDSTVLALSRPLFCGLKYVRYPRHVKCERVLSSKRRFIRWEMACVPGLRGASYQPHGCLRDARR